MSINDRHRDKNGEMSKQHGNTLVSTLRKIYGMTFAPESQIPKAQRGLGDDGRNLAQPAGARSHERASGKED